MYNVLLFLGLNLQPKMEGGLCFRNLYIFNKVMVRKLGQGLINSLKALWVKVIRSKCSCSHHVMLKFTHKKNCSKV